jgi:molybdenum cofactor biosynthesis protein MoaC
MLTKLNYKPLVKHFCLTHTGPNKMVDISSKADSLRYARASCIVKTSEQVIRMIRENSMAKGDVIRTAVIAGIMAGKKTAELIPLCHQVNVNTINIKIELKDDSMYIESYVKSLSKTGVEMEALVAVNISALTIYDMCKAADKGIVISDVKLVEKFGGKSGHYKI